MRDSEPEQIRLLVICSSSSWHLEFGFVFVHVSWMTNHTEGTYARLVTRSVIGRAKRQAEFAPDERKAVVMNT